MGSKEEKERYIVHKPNPKNKKANRRLLIYDQQKQEHLTKEEALANIKHSRPKELTFNL